MATTRRGPGVLFHLTAGVTALFIITILAMVATLFGDPAAPINQWLNDNGTVLLGGEIAAIAVLGTAAMVQDSRLTRQERRQAVQDRTAS